MSVSLPPFLESIVTWLREGYPQGVPEQDYVPLLALLTRRLGADEIRAVAQALIEAGTIPADRVDIGTVITLITDELPRDEDIERVSRHLAERGGHPAADGS